MAGLLKYETTIKAIADWNAEAAEIAVKLHGLSDRRHDILKDAKTLKMPVRVVAIEMHWPIEPVAPVEPEPDADDPVKVEVLRLEVGKALPTTGGLLRHEAAKGHSA
jgi:hypothetical protein